MTHRIGAKGQVVIPQRLRERQGLTPGANVVFEEVSDGVLVKPEPADAQLRGRYRGSGLARRQLEDRAAEPGR
jgi:AbrB family looped-hinge helix DNA binding protein